MSKHRTVHAKKFSGKVSSKKDIMDCITLKHLLQRVPISESTVHRLIHSRKLRAYKLDGMLVFNVLDVQAFLQRRRVGAESAEPLTMDKPETELPEPPKPYRVVSDKDFDVTQWLKLLEPAKPAYTLPPVSKSPLDISGESIVIEPFRRKR